MRPKITQPLTHYVYLPVMLFLQLKRGERREKRRDREQERTTGACNAGPTINWFDPWEGVSKGGEVCKRGK